MTTDRFCPSRSPESRGRCSLPDFAYTHLNGHHYGEESWPTNQLDWTAWDAKPTPEEECDHPIDFLTIEESATCPACGTVITPAEEEISIEDLPRLIEQVNPSSLVAHLDRDRPYDGQMHTDMGERGKTLVEGLTMRDIRDCYIRACYDASGLSPEEWPGSVHDLPWDDMDPIAVVQNLNCWIEKYMGIYPNVPQPIEAEADDEN